MAFSATQPSPHHFITALSIEEMLQDRIINWIIMLYDEVILNNFVLITGQTEHWKWKPLLLWSFANWPIIFCIGKGSNSASHNVFSYVLFLGPSWVFLTCLCSDTWCDLPRTPTLHVAPCTGPCSGPGHLSPLTVWVEALVHGNLGHASWNDASHQAMLLHGSSTRFHKALTLHTRFLPNSPSAVWMPSSPGSGYHTTHLATSPWDAFLSQFELLPLVRSPSLWNTVLASCTWSASCTPHCAILPCRCLSYPLQASCLTLGHHSASSAHIRQDKCLLGFPNRSFETK